MIYYVLLLFFIVFLGKIDHWNESKRKKRKYLVLAFTAIIVLAAMRSWTVGIDLRNQYAKAYQLIAKMPWSAWDNLRYEWGYFAYCKTLSYISTDIHFFIAITALLTCASVGYFIYKNSEDVVMSTFLYVALCQMFMYYTGLRQVLAISILLVTIEAMKKRHWVLFFVGVYIATLFHSSAAVAYILPIFYFLKFMKKEIAISLAAIGVTLFASQTVFSYALTFFDKYEQGYTSSSVFARGYINNYSLLTGAIYIVLFALIYLTIAWKNELQKADNRIFSIRLSGTKLFKSYVEDLTLPEGFLMYGSLLALVFQLFTFTVNILTRFRFYYIPFLYISIPLAIEKTTGRYKKLVKQGIYLVLTLYFLYVCYYLAGSQWGVVPYKFFWAD